MESVGAVAGIVGGGVVVMLGGLVIFAKYITDKLVIENERRMNEVCNNIADEIEAEQAKEANKSNNIAAPSA